MPLSEYDVGTEVVACGFLPMVQSTDELAWVKLRTLSSTVMLGPATEDFAAAPPGPLTAVESMLQRLGDRQDADHAGEVDADRCLGGGQVDTAVGGSGHRADVVGHLDGRIGVDGERQFRVEADGSGRSGDRGGGG